MGRSSSTGHPFLVQRNDAGQFTYHRDIPGALAPLIKGEVQLLWSGRTRVLMGKATIEVSLGTGDEKTAKQRWSIVHPQVDALIQMAELRTRGRETVGSASEVPRLDPVQVRRIAEQAYNDVLATDDREQVEPGFVTPLASVLMQVARGAMPGGAVDAGVAALAARTIERNWHEARLRRRNTWLLDKPIREGELGAEALDVLPTAMRTGDRLAPEEVEALALGIRLDEIPSEVEQRLKENGLDLPEGHVGRRALALAITRAKVRAFNDVGRRDRGAPIDTPERPAVVQPPASKPAVSVPLLSAMQERWITLVRPGDKQIDDSARYTRLFIGLHGDLPVDQITGGDVRAFRDALLECPRNAPQHLAKASIADLATWSKVNPHKRKLGRETINHKAIGTISTLLEQARRDEHISLNPAAGQQLPLKTGDKMHRRPYTLEELGRVLGTSIYQPSPRIPVGGKKWAAWWLPLLSLFTGARLEELGQALVSDVKWKNGIDYIEVTTLSDDEDDDSANASKTLKSAAARRRIPLHAKLIELGFLDYVAALKETKATRLFPDLAEYRKRYTKNWSRWWGRWLTKLGLTDPDLTFHSFRHSFVAELRRLKCNASIMKELIGHEQTDVTSAYGRTDRYLHGLGDLNDEIQRITFETLNVSHLVGLTPWRRPA